MYFVDAADAADFGPFCLVIAREYKPKHGKLTQRRSDRLSCGVRQFNPLNVE